MFSVVKLVRNEPLKSPMKLRRLDQLKTSYFGEKREIFPVYSISDFYGDYISYPVEGRSQASETEEQKLLFFDNT